MWRVFAAIVCGGAGLWLGANDLVPLWAILVLAVLGPILWGLGEWLERREADEARDI